MRRLIKILIGGILVALVATGAFLWWSGQSPFALLRSGTPLETAEATRSTISKAILVSNVKLVPKGSIQLSFPSSGVIAAITAREGETVAPGKVLVELDPAELKIEEDRAKKVVSEYQARLTKLQVGTRPESLTLLSDEVAQAKTAFSTGKHQLINALRAAYSTADDAVRHSADLMINDPRTDNPEVNFTLSDTSLKEDIETGRVDVESRLSDWKDDVRELGPSDNLTKARDTGKSNLEKIRRFLNDLANAVNGLSAGGDLTDETLTTWRTALSTARSAVDEAQNSVETAFGVYRDAGKTLTLSESGLSLGEAGAQTEDIDVARYQLEQALSDVDAIQEKLRHTVLTASSDGWQVKKIYPEVGERVQPGEAVVVLATPELELEMDVPEEDFAGITIGDVVMLRLFAFPDAREVRGIVDHIEPQEVMKHEGSYYRVRVRLDEQHTEWRSGMTGEAEIETQASIDAVVIPRSAVYGRNGKKMVQRINSLGQTEEREVIIGISNKFMIEIRQGLESGDRVVLYPVRSR